MSFNDDLIKEFSELVLANDTDISLTELKKTLGEVYKTMKTNEKKKKTEKPKKAPTAYNIFMKQKMQEIKNSDPSIPPKERMKIISTYWSSLSKEEKEAYKNFNTITVKQEFNDDNQEMMYE